LSKPRILIADDEEDVRLILKDRLELSGFETLESYSGVHTIETAQKHKPDLILLDMLMPAGTGPSVVSALKSRSETQGIPIIVLTALREPELKQEMIALGAQGFIQKPYDSENLVGQIRSLL